MMFIAEQFHGLPVNVDACLAVPLAAPAPRAHVPVVSGSPSADASRRGVAALLRAHWPTTGRHLAQLALAGACVRGGWSDEETHAFLVDVAGDPAKRALTVQATRAAHASGTPYTGFKALEDHVGKNVVKAARGLMGLSDEIDLPDFMLPGAPMPTPIPASNRRQRRAGHVYSHTPGVNAPREKLRSKVPMSDLLRYFLGSDEWKGVWQYDEFKRQLIAVDPPMKLDAETTGLSDSDITGVGTWFEAEGIATSDKQIASAILQAAKLCSFHPVREYLLSLPRPAAMGLLDNLAARVLGNASPSANLFLKLFLISAVRRILTPGTKVDTMLVLYSAKEGRFKSTFAEVLFGAVWFRDQMPSLDGRDASHALEGSWGIEIPELDRIMRAETSTTKEFLSRRTDKYRAFGTGGKIEFPRQCVFIGTTNYPDFLESDTGNRRFWPIEVFGAILLEFVRAYRDAIWAEAVALAMDPKQPHWLDEAQEIEAAATRVSFDKRDPWHEAVESYCLGRTEIGTASQIYLEKIAVGEDSALSKVERKHTNRISAILRKLGCTSEVRWDAPTKKNVRIWRVPQEFHVTPVVPIPKIN